MLVGYTKKIKTMKTNNEVEEIIARLEASDTEGVNEIDFEPAFTQVQNTLKNLSNTTNICNKALSTCITTLYDFHAEENYTFCTIINFR